MSKKLIRKEISTLRAKKLKQLKIQIADKNWILPTIAIPCSNETLESRNE